MSKKPEVVGTGLHFPLVHLKARVLIQPSRLAAEMGRVLSTGQIYLVEGDRLEIDTQGIPEGYEKPETHRALNVVYPDYSGETPVAVLAWDQDEADVTLYGRDVEEVQDMASPLRETLYGLTMAKGRTPAPGSRRPVAMLHADSLVTIQVGPVLVRFERLTKEQDEPEDEPKGKRDTFKRDTSLLVSEAMPDHFRPRKS